MTTSTSHILKTITVATAQDLVRFWVALMGDGGFGRRTLWLVLFDDDGRPAPAVVPVDDIPLTPPPTTSTAWGTPSTTSRGMGRRCCCCPGLGSAPCRSTTGSGPGAGLPDPAVAAPPRHRGRVRPLRGDPRARRRRRAGLVRLGPTAGSASDGPVLHPQVRHREVLRVSGDEDPPAQLRGGCDQTVRLEQGTTRRGRCPRRGRSRRWDRRRPRGRTTQLRSLRLSGSHSTWNTGLPCELRQ